ncbi:MAG: hypothetical protein DWH94_07265 [Planctomycetota bacterium]|nr:MAG: hypothetical protein DWH94_07265 [Planctomycetota bacterium]
MRSKNRNRVIRNIHTDGKGLRRSRLLHLGAKCSQFQLFVMLQSISLSISASMSIPQSLILRTVTTQIPRAGTWIVDSLLSDIRRSVGF